MIETIFGIFRKSQQIPSFETNIFHRPLQKMVCSGATAKFLWRVMMVQQYLLAAVGEISILVEPVLFTSEDLLFLFREGDAISLDIQSYLVTECLTPQTSLVVRQVRVPSTPILILRYDSKGRLQRAVLLTTVLQRRRYVLSHIPDILRVCQNGRVKECSG